MIKELEKQHSRFFSLSLDLLCIAGFDGYFKHINPAWVKTLGWTEQELLSQPFIKFVHSEDQEITIVICQKIADSLETVNFENRYMCADGSYKWLSWNATSYGE